MLNKVCAFVRCHKLINPGDHVICALSGGADSVALLWALYLLREKLNITVSAAHFNHQLRAGESDRDQAFCEQLCQKYDIPLFVGSSQVQAGEKGLEAAAREARYGFFAGLSGKIATAHTADDNAETVLMHLVRGTGLKGLGGISPTRGNIIRPMLTVTRQEVVAFLQEYCLGHMEDSSNATDVFLRNRIRHHIMPLLRQENPSLVENLSQMALRLRQDEEILQSMTAGEMPDVSALRQMPEPLRKRHLANFLERSGVKEPESEHIQLAESLVFSEKPSAKANFPGGVIICRNYDRLKKQIAADSLEFQELTCPGIVELPQLRLRIRCEEASKQILKWDRFTVYPQGKMFIRARMTKDAIRLQGGTKTLKELMIDKKIPAAQRNQIPVICDNAGILGVWGIGANLDRVAGQGAAVEIRFEDIEK